MATYCQFCQFHLQTMRLKYGRTAAQPEELVCEVYDHEPTTLLIDRNA